MRKTLVLALIIWAAWSAVSPAISYAYIDPGTGSYVFQLAIAGLLSALVSVKIFWRQVKSFFLRLTGKADGGGEDGND